VTKHKEAELEAETRSQPAAGVNLAAALVPGLTVLCHPDLERVGERALLTALTSGGEERLSRHEPLFVAPAAGGGAATGGAAGDDSGAWGPRPLADPFLSRMPIRLLPEGDGGAVHIVCDTSRTSLAVAGLPVRGEAVVSAAEVERGAVLLLANRVALVLHRLDPAPPPRDLPGFGLVGQSAPLIALRRELHRLSLLDAAVLLRGETGTGKELAARALHHGGPRSRGPFLAVNLAAVPPGLAAAELFGAARGAFTGADRARAGYFRLAAGGTLLLDEIGEAPLEVQSLLLRALEGQEIQEVGGGEPQRADVRLIAATDADLESAVAAGRFRAPLLHRLASYEVRLPPLRQRRDDLGRLLLHFLRQELAALGAAERLRAVADTEQPWLEAPLVARLAAYDWPGNVRQLRNVARHLAIAGHAAATAPWGPDLERLLAPPEPAVAGAAGDPARQATPARATYPAAAAPAPAAPAASPGLPPPAPVAAPGLPPPAATAPAAPGNAAGAMDLPAPAPVRTPRRAYRRIQDIGDDELLAVLREHSWRLQPTAASLGISRTALYERIERSQSLRKASDLTRQEIEACLAVCGGDLDAAAARLEVSRRGLQRHMKRLGLLG
jgi:two-component system nitrogen regulation response regulator GlnG